MRNHRRYGILGGTFDPPHLGHLVLAQEAYARLELDCVWFVPTGRPPHKTGQRISARRHRRRMVELAIATDTRFALMPIELNRAGPSYTADTLRLLRGRWGPEVQMSLIMGWDMLTSLHTWHDASEVVAGADQLVAVHRPGFTADEHAIDGIASALPGLRERLTLLPAPQLELAASELRVRAGAGLPLRYLVPDTVLAYIDEHQLYGMPADTHRLAERQHP